MSFRDRVVGFRRVKASQLIAHSANFRRHPQPQRDVFRGLLAEIGFAGAVLVRETPEGLILIDGHLRAEELAGEEIPVLVLDLDEAEAAKLLASYDALGGMAEIDAVQFDKLMAQVSTDNPAVQKMFDDLSRFHAKPKAPGAGGDDFDPTPEAGPTRTKPGEVWRIGGVHYLLVGDCTDRATVQRLVSLTGRATVVFTDPPYGVALGGKNRLLNSFQRAGRNLDDIKSDELDPEALRAFLAGAFTLVREEALAEDGTVFVTSPQGGELFAVMLQMMRDAKLPVRHILIWVKNQPTFSLGRLDYDYQHEPILLTWGKRHKRPMQGAHRTSIWAIDKPRASPDHPTTKPIELPENALLNNSDAGDVVFDGFAGSGTTLIAAHRNNRKAALIELEPKFADVVLRRSEAEGLVCELVVPFGDVGGEPPPPSMGELVIVPVPFGGAGGTA